MDDKNNSPNDDLKSALEAMIFASPTPVSTKKLADTLGTEQRILKKTLAEIRATLLKENRGFQLKEVAGGWQMFSNPEHADLIAKLHRSEKLEAKLSQSALDTLTIIAYRQPVIRADIESIRGVATAPTLKTLIDKNLVRIVGRAEVPGRPFLYGTTKKFLKTFGLGSIADLPKPDDIDKG